MAVEAEPRTETSKVGAAVSDAAAADAAAEAAAEAADAAAREAEEQQATAAHDVFPRTFVEIVRL